MTDKTDPTNTTISNSLGINNAVPAKPIKAVSGEVIDIAIEASTDEIKKNKDWNKATRESQINEDYDYSRAKLYQLMETGQEALMGILEVARESDHPRAYEVCAMMIKNNSELVKALTMLHKDSQDIVQTMDPNDREHDADGVTHNNLFVGSGSELLDMLEKVAKNKKTNKEDKQ